MKSKYLLLVLFLICITGATYALLPPAAKVAPPNSGVDPPSMTETIAESQPTTSSEGTLGWYILRNKDHQTPAIDHNLGFQLADYEAYYIGSRDKVIFLTFDEGYENGYTAAILDTLQDARVPAAFFVTVPYIRDNPELIRRMVDEGHLVVNHSKSHPSMPSITSDPDRFKNEISATAQAFKELTGQNMAPFFRPPKGEYNKTSLKMTADLGYKTIFWSFAYVDWIVDQQPNPQKSLQLIVENIHPGEIMLLHAVSKTNRDILAQLIAEVQNEGYRFASLLQLEQVL